MGIFYFYVFWPKHPLKLIFTHKNYLAPTLNIIYCTFGLMNFVGMMKLNILGSEIWPEMAWESCQAAVKPNFNFLNKWGHLLFRKLKFGPLKDKKSKKFDHFIY